MTIAIRILDRALRGLSLSFFFLMLSFIFGKNQCQTLIWFYVIFQMTLVSSTGCGFILAEEECIAGCVMKLPGSSL